MKKKTLFISVILLIIFSTTACSSQSDYAFNIELNLKKNGESTLSTLTKYTIGEIDDVYCTDVENNGSKYIIKCDVEYYPQRYNGTTALDSKYEETIYASYCKTTDMVSYRSSLSEVQNLSC